MNSKRILLLPVLVFALFAGCAAPPAPSPGPRPGWKNPNEIQFVGSNAATYSELAAAADALVRQNALLDTNLRAAAESRHRETGRTPTLHVRAIANLSTARNLENLSEAVANVKDAFRTSNLFAVKNDATADFILDSEMHDLADGDRHVFRLRLNITERATRTEVWSGTATFAK